jgi:hypothetical protein
MPDTPDTTPEGPVGDGERELLRIGRLLDGGYFGETSWAVEMLQERRKRSAGR